MTTLLKCELIDQTLYNKLECQNVSVLELALKTKFEIAEKFNVSLYESTILCYFAQFHYSNIFCGLIIYYAHPLEKYVKSIEEMEIKIIRDNFPFAFIIINPSTFEEKWNSQDQIIKKCLNFVSKSDLVIFSPLNKNFISKGVFVEISEATRLNIRTYLIYEKASRLFIK